MRRTEEATARGVRAGRGPVRASPPGVAAHADAYERRRVWAAALWTLGIAVGCALPGRALPESVLLSFDKLLHLVAFLGFAVLWLRVAPRAVGRVLAWGLAFGVLIEVYQHLAPVGRRFDPLDVLADAAGLAVGLAVYAVVRRRGARTG